MKALVINLDRETARMDFQRAQLEALGIEYERLPACTPDRLVPPHDAPWWDHWERPMTPVEKAVLLSHRAAWQRIVDEGAPMLVLEDDAYLSTRTPEFLIFLEDLRGADHVTLETRGRRKLLARRSWRGMAGLRRLYQDRTGAAAYVLWPSGARKLLVRSDKAPAIADGVICAAYEMVSLQADPPLAVQLDTCAHYAIAPPMRTVSAIAPKGARSPHRKNAGQKLRRIGAQARMGLRRLAHPLAMREDLAPIGPWPRLAPGDTSARAAD
ncbi:glycosyltransferase family 25 protein [Jhaorihella thermophila]|uniref:Glycosyl transferase, family 25 n=1 Tax=Jhaorihella thermophila TaxID=488547 RepID=A0A1H5WKM8_9RHOB|nr:glycosyltransferase family 25 protein [Jhaorihella thermophila]SEF99836.1 glycosyl transferase, family 25 [Jhaorihella thermophila]